FGKSSAKKTNLRSGTVPALLAEVPSNAYTVIVPSTRIGSSDCPSKNITRPPNPRTGGIPGWYRTVSVHMAVIFVGTRGSSSFHHIQPCVVVSCVQPRPQQTSIRGSNRCMGRKPAWLRKDPYTVVATKRRRHEWLNWAAERPRRQTADPEVAAQHQPWAVTRHQDP